MTSTIFTMALTGASAIPTSATVRNGSDLRTGLRPGHTEPL
jgi:hypothetical protein